MIATSNSTVTTTDPGYNPASASASVGVGQVLGATTVPTGLTDNIFVDSFFLPLVIAIIGVWVWKSGFLGISTWVQTKTLGHKDYLAQRQLEQRISQIHQKEARQEA
ncbi:MAG: hypothetical protein A3D44_04445 [Candidatus Staskawiczbacteria bacterium RIFCSPHIGHO2_02_FULL_42_22]|uniref:Uncharacterized protein n=1 Tax=Candidatus Staskawiczbacteria bacterium RIFCSPHIGHO2_02_FULL_42_22 TaxID=1802207 RepID=A0A1G2I1D9_9BACT|nr:MAG: hypothetical protein A3D44_04445 [Candidatus Staskawiczbacteria bacterium RIFCSPHIGHO2_02_FULL_42_22]